MLHHCRRCAVRHRAVQWVLCVTCQLWEWVGGRSSSQAKPGRLEWISSVILQPPGPHAPGRGHKFNSLVCWSHRNLGPPLCVCVCACVWLGSYETKLILRYLIPTTTYIYIGLPQPFFYTWLKTMTYIYLFFYFTSDHLPQVSASLVLFVFHIISNLFQHSCSVYIIALLK